MQYGELDLRVSKTGKIRIPPIQQLISAPKIGSNTFNGAPTVLIPCLDPKASSTLLAEVMSWLVSNNVDDARYRMYAVFGFIIRRYSSIREFAGVSVYFYQHSDAISLKLSMADRCFEDHALAA